MTTMAEDPAIATTGPVFLSTEERDRRYTAVRSAMEDLQLEALLLPGSHNRWEQSMADSRYLSGIGGFQTETLVVFPREAAPTAFVFNRANWWRKQQTWITDVRDGRNRWAENILERLNELGLQHGRVGVSQLEGRSRTPDGVFPYGTISKVSEALPAVSFVDVSDTLASIRAVKSEEEIGLMRRAAGVTALMVDAIASGAHRGNTERRVYASAVQTMLENDGELPALAIIGSGPPTPETHFVPTNRVLEPGDLITGEFEARLGGYGAQIVAPVAVEQCDREYLSIHEITAAAFQAFLPELRPGRSLRDLARAYQSLVETLSKGKCVTDALAMHGRGLGDEMPVLLRGKDLDEVGDQALKENMVFILKPKVWTTDRTLSACVGRTVVITPDGGNVLNGTISYQVPVDS